MLLLGLVTRDFPNRIHYCVAPAYGDWRTATHAGDLCRTWWVAGHSMAARQNRFAAIMNAKSNDKLGKRYTALVSTALAFASPFLPSHDAPVPPSPDGGEFSASRNIQDSPPAFKKSWGTRSMRVTEQGIAKDTQDFSSHLTHKFDEFLQRWPGFRKFLESKKDPTLPEFAEIVKAAGAEGTFIRVTAQRPQDAEPQQIYLKATVKQSRGPPDDSKEGKFVLKNLGTGLDAFRRNASFEIRKYHVDKNGTISDMGRTEKETAEIFKFLASASSKQKEAC